MSTWADLAALRQAGLRPAGMLWVFAKPTEHWNLRAALIEDGAMVIDHDSPKVPLHLLAGLDVALMLRSCSQALPLSGAIADAKLAPARCRVWCDCERALTLFASPESQCRRNA